MASNVDSILRKRFRQRFKMIVLNQHRVSRIISLIREYLQLKYNNGARIPVEYNEIIRVLQGLLPENAAPFPQMVTPNSLASETGEIIVLCIRNLIAKGGIDCAAIEQFNWEDMFDTEMSDVSADSSHAAPDLASD
ncbi:hypothetical protein HA402_008779 [Bradysia odoriphaga]|nr:hypothetical protein HA402_008779 [Bradysia odoriphaga]